MERLLIAIGVILAFVIIVALLPKKLSLTEVDRPSLAASVSPERMTAAEARHTDPYQSQPFFRNRQNSALQIARIPPTTRK